MELHDAGADRPPAAPIVEEWSYRGKLLLAPMVRVNSLAFRQVCSEHGADMVYSEELIDRSLLACPRTENAELGTVDYRAPDGRIVFRTWAGRKERVVLQLGTACAADALRAAEHVGPDVRAIDINMGCPVKFSLQGGMGSALLTQPEKVRDILSTLRRNLPASLPVTCKIRLLEEPHQTLQLAKIIESCGVAALAVHARRKQDRPRFWAQWDMFRLLRDDLPRSLPLVLNGDVFGPEDIPRAYEITGADSLMLARGAMWNPSVFECGRGGATVPQAQPVARYIDLAIQTGLPVGSTKHVAMLMLEGAGKTEPFSLFQRAKTADDLRAAAAALEGHPHFAVGPGRVPPVLEPAPDLPLAPQLPANAWRTVPHHWKPRAAPPTQQSRPPRPPQRPQQAKAEGKGQQAQPAHQAQQTQQTQQPTAKRKLEETSAATPCASEGERSRPPHGPPAPASEADWAG